MKNSPPRTGYRNYWKNEELEIPYTESIDLGSEWQLLYSECRVSGMKNPKLSVMSFWTEHSEVKNLSDD